MSDARRQPEARLDRRPLEEVAQVAADCRLCRLCHTRTNVVFGSGSLSSDVMFVAEGPGYHEDRAGQALVGAAGDLFDELLATIDRTRDDVWVTSVVKCRPPRNRSPFPDEIEQCEGYLFREVAELRPRVICALGNVAIRLLTGRPHRLSQVHGQPMRITMQGREVIVLPLFHPAAALHTPELIGTLREELRLVPRLLRGELTALAPALPTATASPEPAPVVSAPTSAAATTSSADVDDAPQLSLNIG